MPTLYETLGVGEHATEADIKRAYRRAVMRAHPDRNVGDEETARARFLEIKEAYAILSDPAQRDVYDRIFAEEMQRHEARMNREHAEREARERKEREAREALYRERVSLAMQYASLGHNRDVVFGVLIGRECEEAEARQIADSAIALHESRRAPPAEPAVKENASKETKDTAAANPLGAVWFQFLNHLKF